jgi:hypothetical protein
MSANVVRFERLAFLLVLVIFGIVYKLVVGIRMAYSAMCELVATAARQALGATTYDDRPLTRPVTAIDTAGSDRAASHIAS